MASNVCLPQEHDSVHDSSKLQVTILASEWGSSKGGLSTLNRELAIELAKFSSVEVTLFLPKCSDEDKKAAASHSVSLLRAVERPGYIDKLDWLSFPPKNLRIDVVVGHGVKLGHQAQVIRDSHNCKWVQIVHTDPEELGMFKCYENPISTGEQKHHVEVKLCQMADFVVGIGPKLTEAFHGYLSWIKKDVFEFTPGVFNDFSSIQQAAIERKWYNVLVFGRGDAEDFELKGFDIAARSVAPLSDTRLYYVGAPQGKHEEIAQRFVDLGIPANRLKVRGYVDSREDLKQLFCEVDLVLMPSRTEGFGLTGLEALSAGLPVLVSKNSGFGEALHGLPFGSYFVIDSEDPSTWTAAIKVIWSKDRECRLDEVKLVRGSYSKRYSWPSQCRRLIEKIFQVVNGTTSDPETTAQAVGARELKRNKDFTGHSSRVPPKLKRGIIEKSESEQPAGFSSCVPPKRKREIERNKTLQSAARASCPSHIIEGIRHVYQKCEGVILPVPWCDGFSFQIEDIFTRLRIVAKEKTRGMATTKEVTNMTSIFTPHECCEQPLIVLIEGEPGMGKTTYCQKLAFDWASKQRGEWDKSFPRTDVLLLLRCRGIKSTIWDAIEEQILPKDLKPEEKEIFFRFLKENPSNLVLVLDGLDEADPQELELFLDLIQKKQLPGCYIVLTSRHEAGSKVRPYTDTLLEIVGFTTTDAESYIRKYFQHAEPLAKALISKVNFDRDLRELTKNPLNTLLLCVIFEDLKGILPTNRTQLYLEIVLFILRRYESKNGLSSRGDLLLAYKKELMILGETALDSLCKQELYFDDHKGDIKESLLIKFGFLSVQSGGRKRAPCDRYGFFHKSFQEFFSGYFLAFSVSDDVTKSHSVLTDERNRNELFYVFKFMCGIVALRSEDTAVSIVQRIASIINETCGTSVKFLSYLSLADKFINECKTCSENVYTKLVRSLGESLEVDRVAIDSSSLMAFRASSPLWNKEFIGTVFQALTSNSTVASLKLAEWEFSSEVTNHLAQALRVNTCLSSLDLCGNSIDQEGANSLALSLRVNTSLSFLRLSDNSIGKKGAILLAEALRVNTSLSSLDLSHNSVSSEGVKSLAETLKVNTSLSSLDLSSNTIGSEGTNSLAQALMVNTSLSSLKLYSTSIGVAGANLLAQVLRVNTSLSSLNLSYNAIRDEGANLLAEALRVSTSISSLDLSDNGILAVGANSLAQALKINASLSSLDLHSSIIQLEFENMLPQHLSGTTVFYTFGKPVTNFIGDEGANSLAQALRVNTSLSLLNLSFNFIGVAGAISLARALRVNTSLSSLDLSRNSVGDEGASSLAEALKVNTSVSSLNLGNNSIGDEGANSLAQALRVNSSLSSLNLSTNSISGEGANSLAQALRVNTYLSSLDLYSNSIGGEGAKSLAQALRVNSSLSSLDLKSNSIGAEGAKSLAQALRVNSSLSSLDLKSNSIGAEGANSLAQALRVNTSLSSLDLSWNSIGDEGANSLVQALKVNTSLSSLYLICTSIGAKGKDSVAQLFRANTYLTYCDLNAMRIGF
ncbi:NLR family CARD domain-containing protein 3-like isoform X2 [Acropora muricata]|uniref:NLR family CARD domain-containing protein 3-like isoform X2 n=1 Tax=Acropora muricata TaxID=159855 RepID=UPI0034E37E1A